MLSTEDLIECYVFAQEGENGDGYGGIRHNTYLTLAYADLYIEFTGALNFVESYCSLNFI